MRRSLWILPLLCAGALSACGTSSGVSGTPQNVAAQIGGFWGQVAPLKAAVQAELSGQASASQSSTLSAGSLAQLSALKAKLGDKVRQVQVAEAAQLITPDQVQNVTADLRGVLVLSLPADTSTGSTWAATLTLDVKAGSVLASVVNTDLGQPYHPASQSYAAQSGTAPLLRFVAGTLGVYPPRISLGTLSGTVTVSALPALAASDTATVAEYSPTGLLLSVK
ncbi:hypothetical protein FNU79_09055 [Deinococcus detaillensis]|uniref:DUF3251 domain-containing protein n=1 Tax=Deinococcus detaillensis TaxID=2592048 RepID=A0A553V0B8_9DEIO|nr:hypothetical protein [Deinococcus detaillensis]TSA85914.1 hypothetical protein FNU79_09055 [Deinococcus detaillensis]